MVFFAHAKTCIGANTAGALRLALVTIASELQGKGASDDDVKAFYQKVQLAIDTYPWKSTQTAERETATAVVSSVVTSTPMPTEAVTVSCLFLGGVTF